MKSRGTILFVLAFALLVVLPTSAAERDRVWTDQQGRQVKGRLLRVAGENIVLRENGRETVVPIEQLSDPDQAYVRGGQETPAYPQSAQPRAEYTPPDSVETPNYKPGLRGWLVNGASHQAILDRVEEDAFVLKTGRDRELRVTYSALSDASATAEVIAALEAAGRDDLIEVVMGHYERNTGQKIKPPYRHETSPASDAPADEPAFVDAPPPLPPATAAAPREEEEIQTADKLLAKLAADDPAAEKARLRSRVVYGGLTIIVLITVVVGFGFMAIRRAG